MKPYRSLIAIAVMACLALPSSALAASSTAVGRGLTAKLSWTGQLPQQSNLHIKIQQAGKVVYSEPIVSKTCGRYCNVADYGTQSPVRIAQFGVTGSSASVVVDLYTGGAHCCTVAQVFSPSSTGTWTATAHDFSDSGYKLETLGTGEHAAPVFVSANDAFAYRFTDYADSGMPLQIFSLQTTKFVDVTTDYRSLIKQDAAQWLRAYRDMAPKYANTVGVIAPWAADEAELGNASQAFTYLKQQASLKRLNGGPFPVTKGNAAYVTALRAFLKKQGYLK